MSSALVAQPPRVPGGVPDEAASSRAGQSPLAAEGPAQQSSVSHDLEIIAAELQKNADAHTQLHQTPVLTPDTASSKAAKSAEESKSEEQAVEPAGLQPVAPASASDIELQEMAAGSAASQTKQRPLSPEEWQQLQHFQAVLDLTLSNLFIKCMAIQRGLAADSDEGGSSLFAKGVKFLGSVIPIPVAGTVVSMLVSASDARKAKLQGKKTSEFAGVASTMHEASALVKAVVDKAMCRFQLFALFMDEHNTEKLARALVARMFNAMVRTPFRSVS
jgi:hypothetical protein